MSPGSACARGSALRKPPASELTAESSWTPFSKRARQEFSPPATSRAGRIGSRAKPFASSIGSWRNGRDRPRPSTCSGRHEPFDAVPFFWSQHYDVPINYVGHAEKWDELAVEGDIAGKDGLVRMRRAGRTLAVASVFRDLASLEAEVSLEREARGSDLIEPSD